MNWEAVGAVGEILGASGVIITLVYLASQLRQNTKALHSASYSHWNEVGNSWAQFYANFAADLSEIEQVAKFEELTPRQQKILRAEAFIANSQAETAFLQYRAGTLDHDVFEARMAQYIAFVKDDDLLRETWWAMARDSMVPEFAAFIESRFP